MVAVGELSVSFLGTTLKFTAKAAFLNKDTRETHGWTENTNWSPSTIQKLRELKEAMETDLANIHFVTGTSSEVTGKVGLTLRGDAPPEEDGGLGSFLGVEGPDADPA